MAVFIESNLSSPLKKSDPRSGGAEPRFHGFRRIALRLPALLIAAAIWGLSTQSILPQPKGILGFDKVQHLIAYAALAFALGLWFSPERWRRRPLGVFLLTAALAALYGATDEVHQYFVPGRDCNVWDWIADTLGAFLGAAAVWLAFRVVRGRKHG
ncbi:MAG: VanZ family protein [Treponema sp.]|nr:VanZ family protein [Treponema sp.]